MATKAPRSVSLMTSSGAVIPDGKADVAAAEGAEELIAADDMAIQVT